MSNCPCEQSAVRTCEQQSYEQSFYRQKSCYQNKCNEYTKLCNSQMVHTQHLFHVYQFFCCNYYHGEYNDNTDIWVICISLFLKIYLKALRMSEIQISQSHHPEANPDQQNSSLHSQPLMHLRMHKYKKGDKTLKYNTQ